MHMSGVGTEVNETRSTDDAGVGIESIGDAFLLVDGSHRVVALNSAACRMFGLNNTGPSSNSENPSRDRYNCPGMARPKVKPS